MPGRVHTRRQFAQFATPTSRGQSGPLRISFVAGTSDFPQVDVAFAISRKVGNAVVRNTIRRRLRAIIDGLTPPPTPGMYLIRCADDVKTLNFQALEGHCRAAFQRANAN
jgi:ribonuclease P protein component